MPLRCCASTQRQPWALTQTLTSRDIMPGCQPWGRPSWCASWGMAKEHAGEKVWTVWTASRCRHGRGLTKGWLCLPPVSSHLSGCFWFHICSISDSCHSSHTLHTLHRQFTDSVAALHGKDAARVGADPAGSRVLEALLEGSAPPKVRKGVGDMGESVECVENRGEGAPHSA